MSKLPKQVTAMLAIAYDVELIKNVFFIGKDDVELSDVLKVVKNALNADVPQSLDEFNFFDEDGNPIDKSILEDTSTEDDVSNEPESLTEIGLANSDGGFQ